MNNRGRPSRATVYARLEAAIAELHERLGAEATCDAPSPEGPFPEALAWLHNAFEQLHPFLDGNRRTERLALNLVLVRPGYPPVIIFKRQRDAYLSTMQRPATTVRPAKSLSGPRTTASTASSCRTLSAPGGWFPWRRWPTST